MENKPYTIYGDGSQTRTLCYIDDTIKGIIATSEKYKSYDLNKDDINIFNIGIYFINVIYNRYGTYRALVNQCL